MCANSVCVHVTARAWGPEEGVAFPGVRLAGSSQQRGVIGTELGSLCPL